MLARYPLLPSNITGLDLGTNPVASGHLSRLGIIVSTYADVILPSRHVREYNIFCSVSLYVFFPNVQILHSVELMFCSYWIVYIVITIIHEFACSSLFLLNNCVVKLKHFSLDIEYFFINIKQLYKWNIFFLSTTYRFFYKENTP